MDGTGFSGENANGDEGRANGGGNKRSVHEDDDLLHMETDNDGDEETKESSSPSPRKKRRLADHDDDEDEVMTNANEDERCRVDGGGVERPRSPPNAVASVGPRDRRRGVGTERAEMEANDVDASRSDARPARDADAPRLRRRSLLRHVSLSPRRRDDRGARADENIVSSASSSSSSSVSASGDGVVEHDPVAKATTTTTEVGRETVQVSKTSATLSWATSVPATTITESGDPDSTVIKRPPSIIRTIVSSLTRSIHFLLLRPVLMNLLLTTLTAAYTYAYYWRAVPSVSSPAVVATTAASSLRGNHHEFVSRYGYDDDDKRRPPAALILPPLTTTESVTDGTTLRQFLSHPDGYSLAMGPAFFGFYGYLGALVPLEERGLLLSRLNSVTGASAGAMVATLLATGGANSSTREAARYVCSLGLRDFADLSLRFALFKGDRFETLLRDHLGGARLEDAAVPVAVSAYDLRRRRTLLLAKGDAARAARASATFPGLFRPVSYDHDHDNESAPSLLIDGGVGDPCGTAGLFADGMPTPKRVLHLSVGAGWGYGRAPPGPRSLDDDVNVDTVVSVSLRSLPRCGPFTMARGAGAVEAARAVVEAVLDTPMWSGREPGHYELHLDAAAGGGRANDRSVGSRSRRRRRDLKREREREKDGRRGAEHRLL